MQNTLDRYLNVRKPIELIFCRKENLSTLLREYVNLLRNK